MMKKFLAFVCVAVVALFFGITRVSAETVSPRSLYTDSCTSVLTISGSTATCVSRAEGYSGTTTKIVIDQTLQKKSFFGSWNEVASWSETDTGYHGYASNTKSSLSGGTYRLKTVFTVYAGSNSEEITVYSTEKKS